MFVAKGTSLGPYEILAHIGTGGMGEVWCARDRRIGRDVAIKVLPETYPAGDERVRRFEQEARAAGALNHPGLVTIYDVGAVDGAPYIVMELLEGQTLRDAIGDPVGNALPLRKTIEYSVQIASALAVAHEKGIIHRDLKPENLFITADGLVKILDFGLAKLAPEAGERDQTGRHLTSAGMVVGTPGYMSPEQVRARPLDYRTDIFSLGAVMYEMLSGQRAFERESAVETMTAVLNDDPPPLTTFAGVVPSALDSIVRHCMEKNPRERFQSARDLSFQLRLLPEFQHSRTDKYAAIPEVKKPPYLAGATAVAVLALAGVGLSLLGGHPDGSARSIPRTYQQLTFSGDRVMFPTLSPDGKTFAYTASQSGNRDIYVQRVDGRTPIDITADSPDDDSEPVFSRDGSQIAFRSERDGGGIFVMGATGESVRRLTDFGHNPSWSPDNGRIVVATEGVDVRPHARGSRSTLWIVDVRTTAKRRLMDGQSIDAVQPSWSPNGKRIAFWSNSRSGQRDIFTIDPNASEPQKTVLPVTSDAALDWNPVWSPDGRYLYFGSNRDNTMNLWRIAIDEGTGKTKGVPEPISLPAAFSGHFAFSQHGDLVFLALTRAYRLLAVPFDADIGKLGTPRTLFGGTQELLSFEPSPDQESIAFTTGGVQEDVFVANINGTRMRQLTNDRAKDRGVIWSPNGKTLYFYADNDGADQIWSVHVDGSGLTRVTDAAELRRIGGGSDIFTCGISPDGRTLAAQTKSANVLIHLDRPFSQRMEIFPGHLGLPKWSADGKQIVGMIRGGFAVFSPASGVEKLLDHGLWPQWLPDGSHIVFFEKGNVGILDVKTRRTITTAVAPEPSIDLFSEAAPPPCLSRDGKTLYARQTVEVGDIWLMHSEK